MSKVKLRLRIGWSVPITCFLIGVFLMCVVGVWPFPTVSDLGKSSVIAFQVAKPDHLFFISHDASNQWDYEGLLRQLDFEVFDDHTNEVKVELVDHFFYSGAIVGNLESKNQLEVIGGNLVWLVPNPSTGRVPKYVCRLENRQFLPPNGKLLCWLFLKMPCFSRVLTL